MKQKEDNKTTDLEDIFVWPDGSWCFRYELSEFQHKSDDRQTLYFGTPEWENFFERPDNV